MRGMLLGVARWFGVTIGIVLLTSFTVDATLNGGSISQSALGIFALRATEGGCPSGTTHMTDGARSWCIDAYEVSPGVSCPHTTIGNILETTENLNNTTCQPESKEKGSPWVYVTYHQAQELCAKRGMRLPNHEEWYRAALGTPDPNAEPVCNLDSSGARETGGSLSCISASGAYDMVGNVWEWIDGDVVDGMYDERSIPETGYVSDADGSGVALSTTLEDEGAFHSDYFWSNAEGLFGMMRGGFYGSDTDGGLYSIQAQVTRAFNGAAVGFRCIRDL